jgi:chromosome segregation ATPase
MLNKKAKLPQPPKKEPSRELVKGEGETTFPPLFVKVEKYSEILKHLEQLDSYIENFKEILNDLTRTEQELQNRLALTRQAIEKMADTLFILNSKMKPGASQEQEFKHVSHEDLIKEAEDLEGYLKTMKEAMDKIKNEIKPYH